MFDEKQSTNIEKFKRFYCSNDSFHCGPCVWQEEVEEKINNKEGTHDPETDKAQKQRDIADGSAICVCVCVCPVNRYIMQVTRRYRQYMTIR